MGKTLRNIVAGIAGVGISLFAAEKANAAIITHTEDFTSWSQLYNPGANREGISNNGDFYVDGNLGKNIKSGGGLLKNGGISIIYTEISIYQSYKSQGEFHQILSLLHEYNFELFNIYKAIHRNGRLMEIDVMFVRND